MVLDLHRCLIDEPAAAESWLDAWWLAGLALVLAGNWLALRGAQR